jgi:hypothetical protein
VNVVLEPGQGRLPQELRLAGIAAPETANEFLRTRYIVEFNNKFTVEAAEKERHFSPPSGAIWNGSSRRRQSVSSARTIRWRSRSAIGNWRRAGFAAHSPAARSRSTSIWMGMCRSAMVPMWSDASTTPECRSRNRNRRAMEKTRRCPRWKTKSKFPNVPTAPWKSRRGIPTFPRPRLLFSSQ